MEALCIHDYDKTSPDELSFKKDDIVKILDETDEHWYTAEFEGTTGFVPINFLKIKPRPWYYGRADREESEKILLKKSGSICIQPDGAFLLRLSQHKATQGDFSLSVKWDNQVQHFKILRDGSGQYFLWSCKFNSVNALISYHRTAPVSRSQPIFLKDMVSAAQQLKVQALYDFKAEDSTELSFKRGTLLTVLEKQDDNWWHGEDPSGNRGMFPSTYVKAA